MKEKKQNYSLKDMLFNKEKVEYLASLIADAYPQFQTQKFTKDVLRKFPELELKERMAWMRECLCVYLPKDYRRAVTVLLEALSEPCDPTKEDDDFGDFIFAPFNDFVAEYGCTTKDLSFSLRALKEMTMRFSAEDAIRSFLKKYPKETLKEVKKWTKDSHYHVRRLASEGTRPSLPWSQKLELDQKYVVDHILTRLYNDPTRFVVRSVANHLNDLAKKDGDYVVQVLKLWKKQGVRDKKEFGYLCTHALRTAVKDGNKKTLTFLGYDPECSVDVSGISFQNKSIKIGESIVFSCVIESAKDMNAMIDYVLVSPSKNDARKEKVFKIKKVYMKKRQSINIEKKHPLKLMTSKSLYPGKYTVIIIVNGNKYSRGEFELCAG